MRSWLKSVRDLFSERDEGKGAYSNVFKVRRFADGRVYGLKKIDFSRFSKKEKDNALLEVSILSSVKGQNLIAYYDSFIDGNSLW